MWNHADIMAAKVIPNGYPAVRSISFVLGGLLLFGHQLAMIIRRSIDRIQRVTQRKFILLRFFRDTPAASFNASSLA